MIRNVVLAALRPEAVPDEIAAIQDEFRAPDCPGMIAHTLGDDLGQREGHWSFAIVADFTDADAYRAYDADGPTTPPGTGSPRTSKRIARVFEMTPTS